MSRKNRYLVKGNRELCSKCFKTMERRCHKGKPKNINLYYSEWDFCIRCKRIQHYRKFMRDTYEANLEPEPWTLF